MADTRYDREWRIRVVSEEEAKRTFIRGGAYGPVHEIRTAEGARMVRSSVSGGKIQTLVDAFERIGVVKESAAIAGIDRRIASDILNRLQLTRRTHRLIQPTKTKYMLRLPGWKRARSVKTTYPWGVVHKAVTMYLSDEQPDLRTIGACICVPWDTIGTWVEKLRISRGAPAQIRITRAKKRHSRGAVCSTPKEEEDAVLKLYLEDLYDTHETARRLGLHQSYVLRILIRLGVDRRDRYTQIRINKARRRGELDEVKENQPVITRELGISNATRRLIALERSGMGFQQAYETAMHEWLGESHSQSSTPIREPLTLVRQPVSAAA